MPHLPAEIWHQICGYDLGVADFKALRLVSRYISHIGASLLFQTLDVGLDEASCSRLRGLLGRPQLLSYVREVRLWTDVLEQNWQRCWLDSILDKFAEEEPELAYRLDGICRRFYSRDLDLNDKSFDEDNESGENVLFEFFDFEWEYDEEHQREIFQTVRRAEKWVPSIIRDRAKEWLSIREEQLNVLQSTIWESNLRLVLQQCSGLTAISIKPHDTWKIWNSEIEDHCASTSFRVAGPQMTHIALLSLPKTAPLKKFTIDQLSGHVWLAGSRNMEVFPKIQHYLDQITDLEFSPHSMNWGDPLSIKELGGVRLPALTPRLVRLTVNIGREYFDDLVCELKWPRLESIQLDEVTISIEHMLAFLRTHSATLQTVTFGRSDLQLAYWIDFLPQVKSVIMLKRIHFLRSTCPEFDPNKLGTGQGCRGCYQYIEVQYHDQGKQIVRKVHVERALNWLICNTKLDEYRGPEDPSSEPQEFWDAVSWELFDWKQLQKLVDDYDG